ncbi:hypothetical protein [Sphingobacterium multivorum]|uniref:hypothetical protein n=1 Tax=Sphingobacterium multivorum TaxID=28454 RepID=UPI0028A9EF35|nr:hypothetical protein [Sphingobacterium multivorum]
MNKLLLIFASLLIFIACKKTEALSTSVYSEVQLTLVDENGVNVLNSKLTIADLDLYYVTSSGEKVLQNNGNLDLPKNMEITNDGQDKKLRLFANLKAENNEYAESILKVKGYDDITIKVKVQKSGGSLGYSDLFVNGESISIDLRDKPVKVQLKK